MARVPDSPATSKASPAAAGAALSIRLGRGVRVRVAARVNPAALVATGSMVSMILVSTGVLVRAARRPR